MLLSTDHPYWQPPKNCHFGMVKLKFHLSVPLFDAFFFGTNTFSAYESFFPAYGSYRHILSFTLKFYCTFPGYYACFRFNGYVCRTNLGWNGTESY